MKIQIQPHNRMQFIKKAACICATAAAIQVLAAAAESIAETLQKGLFDEEANHDLIAAMQSYQTVIAQAYEQRKLAATAVFRLGECNRKLGKTNEAAQLYTRLLTDFAEQTNLVQSCQTLLAGMQGAPLALQSEVDGKQLFSMTAEKEELKALQALVKDSPDLLDAPESNGERPFHRAARNGYFSVMDFLLSRGADINSKTRNGKTALELVVEKGQKSTADYLLSKGVDPNATESPNQTPLFIAAHLGYRSLAEALLKAKAHPNVMCRYFENEQTPLHAAAYSHKSMVELLLNNGANAQAEIKILDFDKSNKRLQLHQMATTPLSIAASRGNTNIASMFLEHGASLDDGGSQGFPPLMIAIANNQLSFAQWLLDRGANPNAKVKKNVTVVDNTSKNKGDSKSELYGMDKDYTALHLAILIKDKEACSLLIRNKADVNARSSFNVTPLTLSMYQYLSLECVKILLDAGADPNIQNNDGASPLHIAVAVSNLGGGASGEKIKLLTTAKANTEVRDKEGNTPLMMTARMGFDNSLEALIEAGADVNATNRLGQIPLMKALENNKISTVKILLEHKANVNACDSQGIYVFEYKPNTPGTPVPGPVTPPGMRLAGVQPRVDNTVEKMLRDAGATTDYTRLNRILISRTIKADTNMVKISREVFRKQKDDVLNKRTLLETIASLFSSGSDFPFPDFAHVTINRLTSKPGEYKTIACDIDKLLQSGSDGKDVELEWGDVVEIPELDHPINANWGGLGRPFWDNLDRRLRQKVTVVVKGQPTEILLLPPSQLEYTAVTSDPKIIMRSQTLKRVLFLSNLLRTTSDLSRIKVKRPATNGEPMKEIACKLSTEQVGSMDELVLRNGDEIEVPDTE